MKLIVWLGNPWNNYENTKHNVWFMFLDYFKNINKFDDFKFESKFKAELSSWIYKWEKTILIKPQTFMNLSWDSIISITNFYKIDTNDVIVIYDDLSMNFWKIRYRDTWSAWWHNWIKSIIKHFWENFKRIKIGIWFNDKFEVSDWVLSKFSEEEVIDLNNDVFKNTNILLTQSF